MRWMRIGEQGFERTVAVRRIDGIDQARDATGFLPALEGVALEPTVLQAAGAAAIAEWSSLDQVDLTNAVVAAPISGIGKVVCIGLNYRAHAAEAGMPVPNEPVVFLKAGDTVVGPFDDVCIPPGSVKTDYEVELAVVIGRTASYLTDHDDPLQHVAGLTISNDVSEREYQLERGGQWDKGKNCPTFNPLGPELVTLDEVPDLQALALRSVVDGEVRQDSTTADMIFGVAELLRYVSRFMTLYPGDVVNTGTPQGVGSGFAPARFLKPGAVVECSIDCLGSQRQRFVETSNGSGGAR